MGKQTVGGKTRAMVREAVFSSLSHHKQPAVQVCSNSL